MKVSTSGLVHRAPHLPLIDLESILCDVADILGELGHVAGAAALDGQIVQCRAAITACRRSPFSPPLLRALSAKVLELESNALILRRAVRGARGAPEGTRTGEGSVSESPRSGDKRRGPRARGVRARSD